MYLLVVAKLVVHDHVLFMKNIHPLSCINLIPSYFKTIPNGSDYAITQQFPGECEIRQKCREYDEILHAMRGCQGRESRFFPLTVA
ncbi:MAG: hypothetical protein ACHP9Y_02410, partial [Gammaproteobacteria bacterium]